MLSDDHLTVRHGLTLLALLALGAALVLTSAFGLAGALVRLDRLIVSELNDRAASEATRVLMVITDVGGMVWVPWLCGLAALGLLWLGHWRAALGVVASVVITQATVALVKGAVERSRPADSDALVHAAGYAFPSGHAATAAALYGALVLVAHRRLTGLTRTAVIGLAVSLAAAIGASRIYLGAHYPTDVLAGWLLGAAIAVAAFRLCGRLALRPVREPTPA